MKKPIFRVFVSYEIKNKLKATRRVNTGILDTFGSYIKHKRNKKR